MKNKDVNFKLTKHAHVKIIQRGISEEIIGRVVLQPTFARPDKNDNTLVHFIKKINDKYLRVIGRWENRNNLLVISAFYDRRLKGREE